MSSQKKLPMTTVSSADGSSERKPRKNKSNNSTQHNENAGSSHDTDDKELEIVFLKNEQRIKHLEKLISNLSQIVDPTGASDKKKYSYGDTSSSKI